MNKRTNNNYALKLHSYLFTLVCPSRQYIIDYTIYIFHYFYKYTVQSIEKLYINFCIQLCVNIRVYNNDRR